MSGFRVRVVEFGDRPHYQLQWTDPDTGRKKTKSSGVRRTGKKRDRDDAERKAAEYERLLASGEGLPTRITWEQFRERYERDCSASHSAQARKKEDTALDLVESVMRPRFLRNVTSAAISEWLAAIQDKNRGPETAASYGRVLRAALHWAKSVGLIAKVPNIRLPKKQSGESMMKGRAICGEEHDRIKAAVAKVVAARNVVAWRLFLDCLWWSGLRLGEALRLSWEPTATVTAIVVNGSRPVVRFRAAGQKGRRDELWPCPPEFAIMLETIPIRDRHGFVFSVPGRDGSRLSQDRCSRLIGEIATTAGVMVDDAGQDSATAHDYRRAFGTRWSKLVMPVVLKQLMRHKNITTTLKFYVEQDAEKIADELWQKFGTKSNSPSNTAKKNRAIRG